MKAVRSTKKIVTALILFTFIATVAFAAPVSQSIKVMMNSIQIMVNGQKVQTDNILYNGTTYAPIRKVAEMLGKEVTWDSKTNTAHIDEAKKQNPIVTIEMENGEKILMELYPDIAPNTVNNFISLVQKGFYDGLTFHRNIPGFVIQGGDPAGDGTGGPEYSIKGEFMQNGINNPLMHTRGVVSMARSASLDSGGSQFFIMVEDRHHLNGAYAAFGKVIKGMDVVDKIVAVPTDYDDKPTKPQIMKKITVELFGKEYKEPEIIK